MTSYCALSTLISRRYTAPTPSNVRLDALDRLAYPHQARGTSRQSSSGSFLRLPSSFAILARSSVQMQHCARLLPPPPRLSSIGVGFPGTPSFPFLLLLDGTNHSPRYETLPNGPSSLSLEQYKPGLSVRKYSIQRSSAPLLAQ